jgi:hypothetical protein
VLAALTAGTATAQIGGTGAIQGTVFDPSGAVVAGASVVATNLATGVEAKRATNAAGLTTVCDAFLEAVNKRLAEPGRSDYDERTDPVRRAIRELLRAEAKRQGKLYGLSFRDISGGFTNTQRGGPQTFKVLPILVYRVWVDGRPDELVRGVDLVGTPLAALSRIIAASDDYQTFNGYCGAESGFVPVSATSPSLLVQQIEIERRDKGNDKPPLLPAPALIQAGPASAKPRPGTP